MEIKGAFMPGKDSRDRHAEATKFDAPEKGKERVLQVPNYTEEEHIDLEQKKIESMAKLHGISVEELKRMQGGIVEIGKPNQEEIEAVAKNLESVYEEFKSKFESLKRNEEQVREGELSAADFRRLQAVVSEDIDTFMKITPNHGIDKLDDIVKRINGVHKEVLALDADLKKELAA